MMSTFCTARTKSQAHGRAYWNTVSVNDREDDHRVELQARDGDHRDRVFFSACPS